MVISESSKRSEAHSVPAVQPVGNSPELLRTVVFCDFENLFYGFKKNYNVRPDGYKSLMKKLQARGLIESVKVFANWEDENLKAEQAAIKVGMSHDLIDCRVEKREKDYTDFIMLDHIYRTVLKQPYIEQYILITGDGHFDNCVCTLQSMDKTVGIVAVKGSLNNIYRSDLSDWYMELEPDLPPSSLQTAAGNLESLDKTGQGGTLDQALLDRVLKEVHAGTKRGLILTFGGLCRHLSNCGIEKNLAAAALSELLRNGALHQARTRVQDGDETKHILAIEASVPLAASR
jgi:hypothetical protein